MKPFNIVYQLKRHLAEADLQLLRSVFKYLICFFEIFLLEAVVQFQGAAMLTQKCPFLILFSNKLQIYYFTQNNHS